MIRILQGDCRAVLKTLPDNSATILGILSGQRMDWLVNNGFRVRNIEADIRDENSMRVTRSELVVWMGIEIASAGRRADRVVVWSGDRALWRAIDAAQTAGAAVEVVADAKLVPGILTRSADTFIDARALCPIIGQPKKAIA